MMEVFPCHICPEYQKPDTLRSCRGCQKIDNYLASEKPRSRSRKPIYFSPDIMAEAIAELKDGLNILQKIPLTEATVLLQREYLNASCLEIAVYHGKDKRWVGRRLAQARKSIKKVRDG